jgi:hypothetical protein
VRFRRESDYPRPVLWLNGKQAPPGSKAEMPEAQAFREYVAAQVAMPALSGRGWRV